MRLCKLKQLAPFLGPHGADQRNTAAVFMNELSSAVLSWLCCGKTNMVLVCWKSPGPTQG